MNSVDQVLQAKLKNAESSVPDSVWHRVEIGLAEENNSRVVGYFWILGLGLILAMTLGTYAYLSYTQGTQADTASTSQNENNSRIVVTDSYITTVKSVDVKDSTFIKNMKAIKEMK